MKKTISYLFAACIAIIVLSGFVFSAVWEVDPDNYYYGSVEFGDYQDHQFTISSDYRHPYGGYISFTGADASLFSCVSGCTYYLDINEQHTFTVRFSPPTCPSVYNEHLTNYWAKINVPAYGGTIEVPVAGSGTGEDPCAD